MVSGCGCHRHAAGIAKIDDLLVGQALAQLPHTGQAAKALSNTPIGRLSMLLFLPFQRQRDQPVDELRHRQASCSISLGYMLMDVKPGKVLISLISTRPVPFSTKKSQRARPSQFRAV